MLLRDLRVMQVISNLGVGGAQEVVRTLVENLAEAGCTPLVCAFKDGPLRKEIEELGIAVEILPERRYSILALPLFLRELYQIRRAMQGLVIKNRIDVVQTHLLRSLDFLVLTLKYKTPLKVYWTFHNSNFALREDHLSRHKWLLGPKRLAYRWLYRLSARWINGFIAVSDEVRSSILAEIGPVQDKITVICNGVDVRRYRQPVDKTSLRRRLGLAENAQYMVMVATFKEQKGHRYLVEAASLLVSQFPGLQYLLIGDGDLKAEIIAQASAAGLGGRMHFLGLRSEIPDLLAASDYFILPSLWEGLPMALIEAMASGLPVIATEVSGTRQVMAPGETGLLVPPGDSRRLSQAMAQLLSDPARARAMGAAAKRRVAAHFSAQHQAQEHLSLFLRELDQVDNPVMELTP